MSTYEDGPTGPFIVSDTGWNARNGGRCITDFTRTVKFSSMPDDDEKKTFMDFLRANKPGWTPLSGGGWCLDGEGQAFSSFHCTWDSSD